MFLYIRMLSIRGVPNIFIGEFRSVWMHRCLEILNSKHAYLLDDGIIIVDIFNQYLSKGIYKPNFKISRYNVLNLLYGFLCFATGSAKGVPYRLTMCTAFPFEKLGCSEQLFIKNDYTSSLFSGEFKDDDSVFYYFGTKYSEAGYFSMEVEILFLNRVFDYLRKKGFKIVYVAHRDDAKNKLDLIESVGVEVQRFDCPAELHFFRKGSAPKYIGGAFSTAVINIKLIFNSEFVVFFKLPISDVSRNKIDQVIDVYDFYNRIGFDVIDLWEDDPVKVREGLNNR
ncbi:hypothetical protein ABA45_11785 [Marinobacter psychrophilus]|uniref:Uncharacterized protein n=2 Tax=Marinobacter psychrophilus TaxID=330734 RepID=A0A0H4IDB6_9GAMM|nr:hypothetical protein ABA45_11785 [Marinobacter psychrophilus]